MLSNRRNFIRSAAIGTTASLLLPELISEALAAEKNTKIYLQQDDIILFQGDSITDAGRSKTDPNFNKASALGPGYAFLAATDLLAKNPAKNLKIYNKGISGNKVFQLADRWENDCLNLKPTVLSILIGVNDYWHTKTNNYKGTTETYHNDLRALMERTQKALPGTRFIIGEPFALAGISAAVDQSWFPAFFAYQDISRAIATEFGAAFIPYQSVFNKALKLAPGSYWTADGVHPSLAGSELMAKAWLEVVK